MTYQLGTAEVMFYGILLLTAFFSQMEGVTGDYSKLWRIWSFITALFIIHLLMDLIVAVSK